MYAGPGRRPVNILPILLVSLVSISAIVAVMLGVAWLDLGRAPHARTWSAAFVLAALVWLLPFANAVDLIGWQAVAVLMPSLGGLASACIAIGFRERAGLASWRWPLLGVAGAHALVQLVLRLVSYDLTWIVPLTALNAAMFALAARTLRGRRRGERAAERVAEGGLAVLTLANLLVLTGMLGMTAGLVTLRLDRLALATLVLLPVIDTGIGLFTIILLTADLADRTRRLAATDMLSGLLNRRGFEAAARTLLAATRRHARSVALVLIDLDHFKTINDRFGHPAGDRVLQEVAHRISQSIGRRDVFARIGGEEFALILTDVDAQAAECAVEVLRRQVETMTPDLPEPCPVTASFGIAECADGAESLSEMLLRADRALYRSKETGRNRVTLAD